MLLTCVAILCLTFVEGRHSDRRPNVVLLMADDIGYGDVSYTADRVVSSGETPFAPNYPRTPEIDAMARSSSSIVFDRFYAGSAVCSPTRSSCLTGRTPNRECVFSAEGCGQLPAYACADNLPLPPTTYTIAEAARDAGYRTVHLGKWHLGNFFPKPDIAKQDYRNKKWPVSNPTVHGFDEWMSTEASASSSLCNCACDSAWQHTKAGDPGQIQGRGCVVGNGTFSETDAFACTNYWFPTARTHSDSSCSRSANATLACVTNLTQKIVGDDSTFIVDKFDQFLENLTKSSDEPQPFLAVLWLHTNHNPHPAMPEWFHAYTDAQQRPAGDYLGTISQMDAQIGRLRSLLKSHGVSNDTMLWFTSDNGPHTADGLGCTGPFGRSSLQATNGLRQCKASLFEGGIHVPGILEWPAVIHENIRTTYPSITSDYLWTFLDVIGATHPHPHWARDGTSLLDVIEGRQESSTARRNKPLGFVLDDQQAWIDNEMKLLRNPAKGQCKTMLPPWNETGTASRTFLFNLTSDPSESIDLSGSPSYADKFREMTRELDEWVESISHSQTDESGCVEKKGDVAA